ncbi:Lytic transglycosylase [Paramixta manurensis]|uniref:Lytic transglycosylase n=1 Tax=Paramixta manurensis TaxID=2740817 RepID=A0A6M8UBN5_9GAMM|nr:Lytic transglycosylase [Erwiniaceae bacterium PD-1]
MTSMKLCALALCFSSFAQADCFNVAGKAFGLSPILLKAIAIKESKLNPTAINQANRNRTEDVCMMQINSVHFSRLSQLGVTRKRLLSEPCVCVSTGAWVLHGLFRQYGRSWDTVGMYNTGPSPARQKLRLRYAREVERIYRVLQQEESDQQQTLVASR